MEMEGALAQIDEQTVNVAELCMRLAKVACYVHGLTLELAPCCTFHL